MRNSTISNPLTLNGDRSIRDGSVAALNAALQRGADLRIATAFRHNEHIDTTSSSTELVEEVAEFRETYLLADQWSAAFMTLRLPVEIPVGFGPRPSMSFFLYNQDGQQAIARPYLDGLPKTGEMGPAPLDDHSAMPRYHQLDNWDAGTNAPSSNFIYAFDSYRFLVNDRWQEVLSHAADGTVLAGSVTDLADAFLAGLPVKVGIRNLCADLVPAGEPALEHEVLIHAGSCYYYTEQKLFMTGTHPLVRVRPAIPLRYGSRGWDFGWLMVRSDGHVARWLCDPYTLTFQRSAARYALRWFVAAG
ncbi:MAG: hypothetical protein KF832_14885 [Caldilineaceae bacterium]|nr:hypothetical protein [Caldilineaceae bacterium]